MTDPQGIKIEARISAWLPDEATVVILAEPPETPRKFVVVSRRKLTDGEMIAAIGGWYLKQQDAQELRELREDCEAGMRLDSARQALKGINEIAFWDRIKAMLHPEKPAVSGDLNNG